ncbi:hypothetical protein DICPUDRAFT_40987 [Dictyostelium purpureum]|uniref:TRAF-type domain-containing protein n=1 Tax=Dictyostelium purpureum TaxID=5786 RepID=F0ZZ70_DICPU|nr:uncharacterized protein DICPUDRAFT_40987 [Dictyostelium purpureum]EGC30757.1 hypothetical protein DICPUDRAFT_40987 [Dictyostelium purpureum]|eukprot:XP_003292718.1 hypothetical protein DICPUDRAFT_40987 [Dictyostelium purpureum]
MSREPINFNFSELTSVIDEYICPICFETYYKKEIYQCRQGHCSCKDCWEKSFEKKKECMTCKIQVNSFNELSRNRLLENLLLKTDVCCPYSFRNIIRVDESEELIKESNGCKEIIKLEELDNHIEKCSFRFVKCEYHEKGCNDKIRYNENEIHISKCEYQSLNCTHCSNVYLLKTIEQHYLECPSMLIDCFVCEEKIKRGEMYNHLDIECQEVTISCKFSQFGCNDKIKRCNLENHLDQINHTKYLSTAIDGLSTSIEHLNIKNNLLSNSIDELTKNNELLIIKNKQLSNSIDELTKEYKNKWIISNYSKINHNVGDSLISPKFGKAPNLFEIKLYKNGEDNTFIGKIGIYLRPTREQKNITFSITLLNKDSKKNDTLKYNNEITNNGWGWREFIKCDKLNKENGYVTEDDKLQFEFTLTYPKPMPLLSN